jgi:hypothetical protein
VTATLFLRDKEHIPYHKPKSVEIPLHLGHSADTTIFSFTWLLSEGRTGEIWEVSMAVILCE